jgi:Fic family protein
MAPPPDKSIMGSTDNGRLVHVVLSGRPLDARGRYLHWDDMRNRTPPDGLNHSEWWLATKYARQVLHRKVPLHATSGDPFVFANTDSVQELVHKIDQRASGEIVADALVTNLRSSNRYVISSLVEEAITSSQLEGASTTRAVAKELLATGRRPRDRSEQMIVNNYAAMQYAQDLSDRDLTIDDVLSLHRIVTSDTLDDPADAGRLQRPGDDRIEVRWSDDTLLHKPPRAEDLPARLEAMVKFANGQDIEGFMHPVVRAVLLHFWLAYDHPFVDGNGRVARALFYWCMLREGYWLARYLSVSSILRKAPSKYARSYLLTETDANDLTYFLLFQLGVIERSIDELHAYLARKIAESRELDQLMHGSSLLNERQRVIVADALKDPAEPFTIAGQSRRHRVTYQTARTDLLGLEQLQLMARTQVGRKFVFRPVSNLADRLRAL